MGDLPGHDFRRRATHPVELPEGQRVKLAIEPLVLTSAEAEAQLRAWHKVYEGLSEAEIAEIEAIALARFNCSRKRQEDEAED